MKIYLEFADPISETYRKKLQTFSDAVLARGITENRPPTISFPEMSHLTFREIGELEDLHIDYFGA